MGHVDHGKTSLLIMSVRKMLSLVSQGITQHIGAYGVTLDNGHSFRYTRTRGLYCYARGAQVTDIAIIVIADDDIMPNEGSNKPLKQQVPIIFAIKIDKPNSNLKN
jgi:translation initiation factor IF-2